MSEPYTITQADIDGCRKILTRLLEAEAKTGGHRAGNINGAKKSATVTVHFDKESDPFTTAEALLNLINSGQTLALVCNKLVSHFDTHGEAVATDA